MDKSTYERLLIELAKKREYQKLLDLANEVVAEYPDWHIAWHYQGTAYGLQENHEKAITSFIKALEIKPNSEKALYGLSVSFHALKMYTEAIACLLKHQEISGKVTPWISVPTNSHFSIINWLVIGCNLHPMNPCRTDISRFLMEYNQLPMALLIVVLKIHPTRRSARGIGPGRPGPMGFRSCGERGRNSRRGRRAADLPSGRPDRT